MKLYKKSVFFLLISQNLMGYIATGDKERCVTHAELEIILKKQVGVSQSVPNYNEEEKVDLYNNKLNGATVTQILNKIKYYSKKSNDKQVNYRCEYLTSYKPGLKRNQSQVDSINYYCAANENKYENYSSALKRYQQLLDRDDKEYSNEEIMRKMLKIYKKLGDKEKVLNLMNVLGY